MSKSKVARLNAVERGGPMPTFVLRRGEAEEMVSDLGEVMEAIIMACADVDDEGSKARAFDALVKIQTKRNILESELAVGGTS
jgi:hypothetical protein